MNFWNKLMGSVDEAGRYMLSYGEGPGSETRLTLGKFINNGESVLDIGCGPGWNYDHFAQYGPALSVYKGVDYADYFVKAANQRLAAKLDENFTTAKVMPFEVQDCRALEEPDDMWDVVILQDCVEHTNGYELPVQEALRVAKKRVIVAFWHLSDGETHINDDGDDGYGAWYNRAEWEQFLDSLDIAWLHEQIIDHQNKPRDFYIIDKDEPQ